jgi:hypothetical protein
MLDLDGIQILRVSATPNSISLGKIPSCEEIIVEAGEDIAIESLYDMPFKNSLFPIMWNLWGWHVIDDLPIPTWAETISTKTFWGYSTNSYFGRAEHRR